jgi:hypothetical protein
MAIETVCWFESPFALPRYPVPESPISPVLVPPTTRSRSPVCASIGFARECSRFPDRFSEISSVAISVSARASVPVPPGRFAPDPRYKPFSIPRLPRFAFPGLRKAKPPVNKASPLKWITFSKSSSKVARPECSRYPERWGVTCLHGESAPDDKSFSLSEMPA